MNTLSKPFAGICILVVFGWFPAARLDAQTRPLKPTIASASSEAESAIQLFKFPENLKATVFAAEPDIANPVAFHVDYQGRVFVCETFRQDHGVEDNRSHPEWLNDDLAAQSVADRLAYMKKHLGDDIQKYGEQDDRVRLLLDTDGDGVANDSIVFSDRYNRPEMGTGAGVLSYRNKVYFTCIPDLFALEDRDGDNVAEIRESLQSGFGIRFAFRGHDLHGLIVGPDRRLYFSIGDRGYKVSPEIHDATSGAVFRCELDGSDLEVIATGMRNPQELAFDDYGNLFTGDNNSDSGDKARWVYVVPGGDTGWRMHYQYLTDRGPFNREMIWGLYDPATSPAYIVPPIDHVGDGPSGLAFYPGTGLDPHFASRFFFADFRGAAAISGIRTFRNQPDGAFFKVTDMEKSFWQILPTDVDFGPDGRLYISDWVFGWAGVGKGRLYSFHDPKTIGSKNTLQTKELLAGKIKTLPVKSLAQLLAHRDRRVRQEAQFELVDRLRFAELCAAGLDNESLLARLHGIWGAAILARFHPGKFDKPLSSLLRRLIADDEPEIRTQAIHIAGEHKYDMLRDSVVASLNDDQSRVRYFAAQALHSLATTTEADAIAKLLASNADQDPIVRHGGIMALTGIAQRNGDLPASITAHPSRSVRLGAVIAMRKNKLPEIESFLSDRDPQIILEAARAIYDCPIPAAMPALGRLIDKLDSKSDDALVRRVLNANMRLGTADGSSALSQAIQNPTLSSDRKIEAIELLANWTTPNPIDRVHGDWRPIATRSAQGAIEVLSQIMTTCLKDRLLADAAIDAAAKLKIKAALPSLKQIAFDKTISPALRARAFEAMNELDNENLGSILAEFDPQFDELSGELLGRYCSLQANVDPEKAKATILNVLDKKSDDVVACQMAIDALTQLPPEHSNTPLMVLVDSALLAELPAPFRLDVFEAAAKSKDANVQKMVNDYRKFLLQSDLPGGKYHDCLQGGDAERGREIFWGKTEVSCVRCHKINGNGGEVGPDLSVVGKQRDRTHILESITLPNKSISDGYAQTIILTDEGLQYSGLVKSRDGNVVTMINADGQEITIFEDTIDGEKQGQSSMPTDLMNSLTDRELRDLVEFLATQIEAIPVSQQTGQPSGHQ